MLTIHYEDCLRFQALSAIFRQDTAAWQEGEDVEMLGSIYMYPSNCCKQTWFIRALEEPQSAVASKSDRLQPSAPRRSVHSLEGQKSEEAL